jgi:predicted AlkP superfamily phosphohydrolase/phosphomutase
MPVITGSDRIGHFLWHVYEDDKNPLHYRFLAFFQEIDKIIGEIYNKLNEDDTFIILSDHGMEKIEYNVNLNKYLEDQGFLLLAENFRNYNRISKGSKAFALDPGRIYINKRGSYPNGTVKKEYEKIVLDELESLFYGLKFEKQRVIKKVYKKDDIYSGKEIKRAPDMVIIENKGFNLKSGIGKEMIFEDENNFSGKHNQNSFILINKEIDVINPSVEDIVSFLW